MSATSDIMLNQSRGIGERPSKSTLNQGPKGTNYCLLVGIDHYEHAETVPTLQHAVEDVTQFKKLIETKFSGRMVDGNKVNAWDITFMTDETDDKPTADNIEAFFMKAQSFEDKDNLVIYFAGHGDSHANAVNDFQSYLIPYDGDPAKSRTLLRWDNLLNDYIVGLKCHHVLLIVDTCYCGVLHNLVKGISQVNLKEKSTVPNGSDYYSLKSRYLLTSTGSSEKVPDESALAQGLISTLRLADAPSVSFQDLFTGICKRIDFLQEQQANARSLSKLPLPAMRPFGDTTMHAGGHFVFYQPKTETLTALQSSLQQAFFDIDFKDQKRAFAKEDLQKSRIVLTVLNGSKNAGHSVLTKALMAKRSDIFSNASRRKVELQGNPLTDIIARLEYPTFDAFADAIQQTLKDSPYILFVIIPSNDSLLPDDMAAFYTFWHNLTDTLSLKLNQMPSPHSFFLFLLNQNMSVSEFDKAKFIPSVNSTEIAKTILPIPIKVLIRDDLEEWCTAKGDNPDLNFLKELSFEEQYADDVDIHIEDAILTICENLKMSDFGSKILEYKF